jgi:hypothetical protein
MDVHSQAAYEVLLEVLIWKYLRGLHTFLDYRRHRVLWSLRTMRTTALVLKILLLSPTVECTAGLPRVLLELALSLPDNMRKYDNRNAKD